RRLRGPRCRWGVWQPSSRKEVEQTLARRHPACGRRLQPATARLAGRGEGPHLRQRAELRVGVKALMEGDRLVASGGEHAGDRIDHVVSGTEGYVDGPPGHPGVRIEGVAEVSVVGGSW